MLERVQEKSGKMDPGLDHDHEAATTIPSKTGGELQSKFVTNILLAKKVRAFGLNVKFAHWINIERLP